MNYRHAYHAGNFADIFKHLIVIAAINRLHKKDKPYTILDLYAGRGMYSLDGIQASKSHEAQQGIYALKKYCIYSKSYNIPQLVSQYLEIIGNFNGGDLVKYPGSPLIASYMLAENSLLKCSELHIEEFEYLQQVIEGDYSVQCYNLSAKQMLKKSLPSQKRGVIIIDPAFEEREEFVNIIDMCRMIKKQAMNIPVLIWYPIKNLQAMQQYTIQLKQLAFTEVLRTSFTIPRELVKKSYNGSDGLYSCGVDIINPGDLEQNLETSFQLLEQIYPIPANVTMQYL